MLFPLSPHRAGININPVEGLKHYTLTFNVDMAGAGININPVEGLKLKAEGHLARLNPGRNQHQPSRGIKTEK